MSYENVKRYLDNVGLGNRIVIREQIGATVTQAAEVIGCEPERIAKTMSFLVNENPIIIVSAGDAKVNGSKYKSHFHQKSIMISSEKVEELVGHMPGAVCPFALNENVRVYLDISLKRFDVLHTAGGSLNTTVELSLEELEKHSNYTEWVDVCAGWLVNG